MEKEIQGKKKDDHHQTNEVDIQRTKKKKDEILNDVYRKCFDICYLSVVNMKKDNVIEKKKFFKNTMTYSYE